MKRKLTSKFWEKITLRRTKFFNNEGHNFNYVHNALEKNVGKVVSIVKIKGKQRKDLEDIGKKIAMHIAASAPMALDKNGLDKKIIDKELEIIKEELKNSGKKNDIIDKISIGKINKFISDNTLLDQIWIMDPKKKVKDILTNDIKIIDFVRFKVGEGV